MFLSKKSWFQLPDFRNLSTIIQLISLSISLIFILAMLEEFKFGGNYRAYLADVAIWLSPATLMNISLLMIGNNFFSRIRLFSYIKGYLLNHLNCVSSERAYPMCREALQTFDMEDM